MLSKIRTINNWEIEILHYSMETQLKTTSSPSQPIIIQIISEAETQLYGRVFHKKMISQHGIIFILDIQDISIRHMLMQNSLTELERFISQILTILIHQSDIYSSEVIHSIPHSVERHSDYISIFVEDPIQNKNMMIHVIYLF